MTCSGISSSTSAKPRQDPPSRPKESNRTEPEFFCLFEGALDVFGFTAGGERDQQIAGRPKRPDLSGEEFRIRVVVADGGQQTAVSGQRNRWIGSSIGHKAAGQFGREVSAVRGAASVAANQNFVSGEQGLAEQIRRHGHRILQVENGANGRDGVIQRGADGHMAGTFFGELADFKLEKLR